jgi:hypothetical protein
VIGSPVSWHLALPMLSPFVANHLIFIAWIYSATSFRMAFATCTRADFPPAIKACLVRAVQAASILAEIRGRPISGKFDKVLIAFV